MKDIFKKIFELVAALFFIAVVAMFLIAAICTEWFAVVIGVFIAIAGFIFLAAFGAAVILGWIEDAKYEREERKRLERLKKDREGKWFYGN